MYIYTPLCRYWITLYRYVLVFIVPHVDIELEDNKQFISNIPRIKKKTKKYIGRNLKTTELLDCELIGVCTVIRSDTVYRLNMVHYNSEMSHNVNLELVDRWGLGHMVPAKIRISLHIWTAKPVFAWRSVNSQGSCIFHVVSQIFLFSSTDHVQSNLYVREYTVVYIHFACVQRE